ncbi:MAG: hypothetical protein M1122_02195 [Candidatus Marsarchaeota archaeon]|nr:hypothetical protein [Candidatus Marsarchaeota archaeon]
MRSADAATLFRTLLVVILVYAVVAKFNPIGLSVLLAVIIILDAVDGFLAVNQISNGKIGFITYLKSSAGNVSAKEKVKKFKSIISKHFSYGPRMDIAGDRVVEYFLWIVFTYVHIVPLFVLLIIIIRHSFVDALMAAKGTSSKMKSKFAKAVYSSNIGRGGINVVKFLTFAYLSFAYVWGYPIIFGYILIAILVTYVLLRGMAEAYESLI